MGGTIAVNGSLRQFARVVSEPYGMTLLDRLQMLSKINHNQHRTR